MSQISNDGWADIIVKQVREKSDAEAVAYVKKTLDRIVEEKAHVVNSRYQSNYREHIKAEVICAVTNALGDI